MCCSFGYARRNTARLQRPMCGVAVPARCQLVLPVVFGAQRRDSCPNYVRLMTLTGRLTLFIYSSPFPLDSLPPVLWMLALADVDTVLDFPFPADPSLLCFPHPGFLNLQSDRA